MTAIDEARAAIYAHRFGPDAEVQDQFHDSYTFKAKPSKSMKYVKCLEATDPRGALRWKTIYERAYQRPYAHGAAEAIRAALVRGGLIDCAATPLGYYYFRTERGNRFLAEIAD